ncbi:MAG: hypothetical protein OXP74_17735 [Acidobacteriota bacterium]|nr:hypothetical protein [Acidobacteriota bacterium]
MSPAKKKGIPMDAMRRALEDAERHTGKRLTAHKANYGHATMQDVARAMLMSNRVPSKPSKKRKG